MSQVLTRAWGVLRRPLPLVLVLLLTGGGCALVAVPILGVPGYELAAVLALAQGLLGPFLGIAAARQEGRLLRGVDPRPRGAIRHDGALESVALPVFAAFTLGLATLLPPFAVAVVHALVSTRCDPFAQVGFFPWLTIPSALTAAATGVFCGLSSKRLWGQIGCLLGALLLFTVWAAWPVVTGPQLFVFSHLGGYLPGPLYDEALALGPPVYWFRLESLGVALVLIAFAACLVDLKDGTLGRPGLRPVSLLTLGLATAAVLALEERGPVLGTRMSDEVLEERLGARKETEHLVLSYPRSKPKEEVDRAVRDLEFRLAQVTAFLGQAPAGKVHVWWYRSAGEKLALVGAAGTQFAKPWRREVHLNDEGFPHRVAKHELMHALAGPLGAPPFGVTATLFGLAPNPGLVEGLAVAGDDPIDELTLHEWAAAMKKQSLLPDARTLFSLEGFYAAPPSRAYTAAGSFIRWLGDTHGPEPLRDVYRDGDFQRAYHQPLGALVGEWEKFLDAVPLEPAAVAQAFARFHRGSLFERACAREVASLSKEAHEQLSSDPETAAQTFHRCGLLQPDEPGHALMEAQALARAGRRGDALALLASLAGAVKGKPALSAEVAMARADLEQARGEAALAKARLDEILTFEPSAPMERTARVKLLALADEKVGDSIYAYFKSGKDDVKLLVLREALARAPRHPILSYLLGRRLAQAGAPTLALPYLRDALDGELPEKVRLEALRLTIEAHYLAGDCAGVRAQTGALPSLTTAQRRAALEWQERCDFEEKAFSSALVPEEPLR
ncbi:MAG: hypothetical protein K1X89_17690 [Myxococcaceae bacterium]|nr:hypothetical protein [Myxococcaceae bacterium]